MVATEGEAQTDVVVVETPAAETVIVRRRRKSDAPKRVRVPKVVKEIRKEQASCTWVIPRKTFIRVVKEIMGELGSGDLRIQTSAVDGLLSATEAYMVERFSQADRLRAFCKSETLTAEQLRFIVTENKERE